MSHPTIGNIDINIDLVNREETEVTPIELGLFKFFSQELNLPESQKDRLSMFYANVLGVSFDTVAKHICPRTYSYLHPVFNPDPHHVKNTHYVKFSIATMYNEIATETRLAEFRQHYTYQRHIDVYHANVMDTLQRIISIL